MLLNVIQLTELDGFLHGLLLPVVEGCANHGSPRHVAWKELVHVSPALQRVFVVLDLLSIFFRGHITNARSPEEDREDVLAAAPTLILLVHHDLPLT